MIDGKQGGIMETEAAEDFIFEVNVSAQSGFLLGVALGAFLIPVLTVCAVFYYICHQIG